MTLKELKYHFENSEIQMFNYGISKPFSWRGVYSEVAFSFVNSPTSKAEILANIEIAYENVFEGYKGGDYKYNDFTDVHFEDSIRSYTDGGYCAEIISEIEQSEIYPSQEYRLIKIAF